MEDRIASYRLNCLQTTRVKIGDMGIHNILFAGDSEHEMNRKLGTLDRTLGKCKQKTETVETEITVTCDKQNGR